MEEDDEEASPSLTGTAGRRRGGVPNDVVLKVRVVVRRLLAQATATGSASGNSGWTLEV